MKEIYAYGIDLDSHGLNHQRLVYPIRQLSLDVLLRYNTCSPFRRNEHTADSL